MHVKQPVGRGHALELMEALKRGHFESGKGVPTAVLLCSVSCSGTCTPMCETEVNYWLKICATCLFCQQIWGIFPCFHVLLLKNKVDWKIIAISCFHKNVMTSWVFFFWILTWWKFRNNSVLRIANNTGDS